MDYIWWIFPQEYPIYIYIITMDFINGDYIPPIMVDLYTMLYWLWTAPFEGILKIGTLNHHFFKEDVHYKIIQLLGFPIYATPQGNFKKVELGVAKDALLYIVNFSVDYWVLCRLVWTIQNPDRILPTMFGVFTRWYLHRWLIWPSGPPVLQYLSFAMNHQQLAASKSY